MIALHEIVRQYPVELQKPEFYDPMIKEYLHHHMLFRKEDIGVIRSFTDYIEHFDFNRLI